MMEKELSDWKSQYHQLNEQLEREQKYVSIIFIINLKLVPIWLILKKFFLEKHKK